MALVGALLTQLLHIALMCAAAPALTGVMRWMEARLAGRVGPPPQQPWRDLVRRLRKQRILAESASEVTVVAPAIAAAAIAVAGCLVPSFALGMISAPFADLLVIAGLLALARCCVALAALDAGTMPAGIGASRSLQLACLGEPALLVVFFALSLPAGSLSIDAIATMQMENGATFPAGIGTALAGTLLAGLVATTPRAAQRQEFGGPDLALLEASDAARLLVWFNLIGAMFLPFGMASPGHGPVAWLAGIACWLVRTLILAAALALLHTMAGRLSLPREARLLGLAVLIALLAAIFLLADMGVA